MLILERNTFIGNPFFQKIVHMYDLFHKIEKFLADQTLHNDLK